MKKVSRDLTPREAGGSYQSHEVPKNASKKSNLSYSNEVFQCWNTKTFDRHSIIDKPIKGDRQVRGGHDYNVIY